MEESQRGNDKGKSKVSGGYKLWTLEESNELLQLMVDAANGGWRDSNGMLSKQTSHPAHVNFQTDTFADSELLRIAIGNGTAIGRNSIALGDDTDARTLGVEESRRVGIDDLSYDYDNHAFIPHEVEAATFQDLSPKQPNSFSNVKENYSLLLCNCIQLFFSLIFCSMYAD
ncbi:hypothetical protein L3X38_026696 [Prunus dulcis]|uniref:Uncharacterized protein n=1 Tax=Prunus dulcis TaxID=3755 RepID=A0AAD4VLH4_PRUDU|nr:hypothetical protein L3X38_026696 [Prunus dulcis]